mgnify:FL=1
MGIGPYKRSRKINKFRGRTESSAPTKGIRKTTRVRRNTAAFPVLCRGGPMWALAPTKDITRFHDFGGRTESSAPTEGFENHACPAKIAAFSVPRRRGRCLHRPAESTRFMTVFRRKRVGFPFSTVGADDPVRPPELSVFTENRCEFVTFWRADVGIGPYERPRKINEFRGRTESSAPTNGHDESQRVSFLTPPPQTRLRGFFCPRGAALGKMAHESVQQFEFGRCIYI